MIAPMIFSVVLVGVLMAVAVVAVIGAGVEIAMRAAKGEEWRE